MDEARLDALVLRSVELHYPLRRRVSRDAAAAHGPHRLDAPGVLSWPRERQACDPRQQDRGRAGRTRRLDRRPVALRGYVDSPQEKLAGCSKKRRSSAAKVGFEKDYWSRAHWEAIAEGGAEAEDGRLHRLMDRVRWIKTGDEVELIRRAPTCWTTRTWKRSAASDRATPSARSTPT
jgi:Xaa-Pro aminopeptidase